MGNPASSSQAKGIWPRLTSNKYLFFACLGLLGGLLGALLAEPPMILTNTLSSSIAGTSTCTPKIIHAYAGYAPLLQSLLCDWNWSRLTWNWSRLTWNWSRLRTRIG